MSTTFSAKEPALGYYYQIIRGLVLLLDEDRMESPSLSFACLDDISIENEEETDLYQLKLHVSTAQLTDRYTPNHIQCPRGSCIHKHESGSLLQT